MLQKSREITYAIIAMVFITLGYLLVQVVYDDVPSASSFWGHSIGVLGFILMLMTEVLYSLRKRSKKAIWGKMSNWLEFHIFTGLVGPFMVLLHPGWQFNGIAGVLSLLTILIVISGIIGRFIYTSIPRTADGLEIDLADLRKQAAVIENRMEQILLVETQNNSSAAVYSIETLSNELRSNSASGSASIRSSGVQTELEKKMTGRTLASLSREHDRLNRAIFKRQTARKLFSFWHAIHIPLGLTLFLIAFVHIGAAIYYSVLLK